MLPCAVAWDRNADYCAALLIRTASIANRSDEGCLGLPGDFAISKVCGGGFTRMHRREAVRSELAEPKLLTVGTFISGL